MSEVREQDQPTLTIYQPFLWWLGLTSLMRDAAVRGVRDAILRQVQDQSVKLPDGSEMEGARMLGVNLRIVTWRRVVAVWNQAESTLTRRAGVELKSAYEQARSTAILADRLGVKK
jgi:hypothetical protein